MTKVEYLNQAYRLDMFIQLAEEEICRLEQQIQCISSPSMEENYCASLNSKSPFEMKVLKLIEAQERQQERLVRLNRLKEDIRKTIDSVGDQNERLVLIFRYLRGYNWTRIAREMGVNDRTVRRWHKSALFHMTMPDEQIRI